jgi:hypothetical protein
VPACSAQPCISISQRAIYLRKRSVSATDSSTGYYLKQQVNNFHSLPTLHLNGERHFA